MVWMDRQRAGSVNISRQECMQNNGTVFKKPIVCVCVCVSDSVPEGCS